MDEIKSLKNEIESLKKEVKTLSNILYGISDDVRTKAVIRKAIIVGEHTTNKPSIMSATGKKYNLQTV